MSSETSKHAYAGPKEDPIVMGCTLPEAGFGWKTELRHLEKRLLDALFPEELKPCNISGIVLDLATVDAHVVVITHYISRPPQKRILSEQVRMCLLCSHEVCVYHNIGVGSNVVYSTISGNAKASVRGTDNKQFPCLYYVRRRTGYTVTQKPICIRVKTYHNLYITNIN